MLTRTATGAINQILGMDGTAAIKDAIHDVALTLTGTPTTGALLGATAPNIGSGKYTICKAATPFAAGAPITIAIVCETTWAGNDNAYHWLFEMASGTQRIIIQKTNLNLLRIYTKDAAGVTRIKSLSATGWAANVPHVIVATLDASNNQRLWLDGVEATTSSGAGVRESAVGSYVYFGSDSAGGYMVTGTILAAIYSRVLTDIPTTSVGGVSFTFDNSLASQYTAALPVLGAQNIDATFFALPGLLGTGNYMSAAQVQAVGAAGHEIGSHSWSHPDLTTLTPEQLTDELSDSKDWIETNVGPCSSFASPNGAYNDAVLAAIKLYYASHRTATDGQNSPFMFDEFKIKVKLVLNTTTPAEVAGWIQDAVDDKTWLILVYHTIDNSGDPNTCSAAALEAHIISAKASGLPIWTMEDGAALYAALTDDSGVGEITQAATWAAILDVPTLTVSGLATGNAVRLYNSSEAVVASAVESGGVATLSFPYDSATGTAGALRVYKDNTYTQPLDSYFS